MDHEYLRERIERFYELKKRGVLNTERGEALNTFNETMDLLESGELRTASYENGRWQVNSWVKEGLMLGFPLGNITVYNGSTDIHFVDKETFPLRKISPESGIRVVPPAAGMRRGSYAGKGVVLMSPAYANVGAHIEDRTMVENLAGSCCQIGYDCHISAGAVIGGVLDPIEATPVIIGNNVLLGESSGVTQGSRLDDLVTLAPGVHISKGTAVIDPVRGVAYTSRGITNLQNKVIIAHGGGVWRGFTIYSVGQIVEEKNPSYGPEIPRGALVIPGMTLASNGSLKVTPMVIKYINSPEERSYALEDALRS